MKPEGREYFAVRRRIEGAPDTEITLPRSVVERIFAFDLGWDVGCVWMGDELE